MTPLRRLLHYLGRHKQSLLAGFACIAISGGFSLAKPMIVGNAVNELTKAVSRGLLIRYGLLLIGVAAVEGFFLYLQRWIIVGASRRIEYEMRNDFYQHLQKLPVRYYQEQRTGDLMSRATNDIGSVRMLIGPAIMYTVNSLIIVTGAQSGLTATFYPMLHGLIGTMFGIVFLLGGRRMLAGQLSIGHFVALQFYLGRMIWPLIALGWVINLYQRGMASMVRLHEVWSVAPDVLTEAGTPVDEAPHGDIDVRDLTFSYGAQPV